MNQRTCVHCGTNIAHMHGNQRYCSDACQNRKKWLERERATCSQCSGPTGYPRKATALYDPETVRCRECQRRHPKRPKRVGPKLCAVCSCVIPSRRKYCDPCRDAKGGPWQRRTVTPAGLERRRQYRSREHKAERLRVLAEVESGDAFCWRCGQHIPPGSPFHLGHDDDDRSIYRGAECPECNLRAAARKGRRMQHHRARLEAS